jgi:hypothetical protein
MKKSYFASFLLTLFFGPLGLFYSSTAAALAFVLIDIAVGLITYSIGLIFLWPVHILVGIATVGSYNSKIELEAARHSELVMSLRGVGQQPQALPENTAPRKKPGGDANFYIWGFIVLAAIIFIFKKSSESEPKPPLPSEPSASQEAAPPVASHPSEEKTLTSVDASGPSFDCSKAVSPAELLICSDPELSRSDRELSVLFRNAKALAPDKAQFRKENAERWKQRETQCTDRPCLIQWYEERTYELHEFIRVNARGVS